MMVSSFEVETLELGSRLNQYLLFIFIPFQWNEGIVEGLRMYKLMYMYICVCKEYMCMQYICI